jgi:hypothetical protein
MINCAFAPPAWFGNEAVNTHLIYSLEAVGVGAAESFLHCETIGER